MCRIEFFEHFIDDNFTISLLVYYFFFLILFEKLFPKGQGFLNFEGREQRFFLSHYSNPYLPPNCLGILVFTFIFEIF